MPKNFLSRYYLTASCPTVTVVPVDNMRDISSCMFFGYGNFLKISASLSFSVKTYAAFYTMALCFSDHRPGTVSEKKP
jgi:hypothetical protein